MDESKPSLKLDSISIAQRNAHKQDLFKKVSAIGTVGILQLLSEIEGEFAGDTVKEPIAYPNTFEIDSDHRSFQSILDEAKDKILEHKIKGGLGKP